MEGLEFPCSLFCEFNHKLADRNREIANDWLAEAGKNSIVRLTRKSGAEESVSWKGHLELHERVDGGVCARIFGHSLQVFQVRSDGWGNKTFQVEVDKGLLDR